MTPASYRPLRRKVEGGSLGPLVVEITADTFTVRPYRGRKPLFTATYGEIVRSVLLNRPTQRQRRKRVKRGKV